MPTPGKLLPKMAPNYYSINSLTCTFPHHVILLPQRHQVILFVAWKAEIPALDVKRDISPYLETTKGPNVSYQDQMVGSATS